MPFGATATPQKLKLRFFKANPVSTRGEVETLNLTWLSRMTGDLGGGCSRLLDAMLKQMRHEMRNCKASFHSLASWSQINLQLCCTIAVTKLHPSLAGCWSLGSPFNPLYAAACSTNCPDRNHPLGLGPCSSDNKSYPENTIRLSPINCQTPIVL